MDQKYQLIVIGAGSGGLVAAEFAAKLGARVALIEAKPDLGGECLHSGCVPSKALIHAARTAWLAGHSLNLGVQAVPNVDYSKVIKHVRNAIEHITNIHDNDQYYEKLGVKIFHGAAKFVGPHQIQVLDQVLEAKKIIIATGSRPSLPDIDGLTSGEYLTNESIFELKELPSSLTVIGGGPIGCELGQAYAMLGTNVTIIQSGPQIMPRDEAEAAARLRSSLEEMGVNVIVNAKIDRIKYTSKRSNSLYLADGKIITSQALLVATGRSANTLEGLNKANVSINQRGGIKVNAQLKTSASHIYAIGDCNNDGLQFTHVAAEQAIVAVQNALFSLHKKFDPALIPWTTFTTPEIAHFGPTKADLSIVRTAHKIIRTDYREIDKSIAEAEAGYVELVYGARNRLIAATVVGANAAEILAQITISKALKPLSATIQAYPTYAIGLKQAVANNRLNSFTRSPFGKLAKQYLRTKG